MGDRKIEEVLWPRVNGGGGRQEGLSLASDPLVQNVRLAIDYVSLVRSIKVTGQDEYRLVMYSLPTRIRGRLGYDCAYQGVIN